MEDREQERCIRGRGRGEMPRSDEGDERFGQGVRVRTPDSGGSGSALLVFAEDSEDEREEPNPTDGYADESSPASGGDKRFLRKKKRSLRGVAKAVVATNYFLDTPQGIEYKILKFSNGDSFEGLFDIKHARSFAPLNNCLTPSIGANKRIHAVCVCAPRSTDPTPLQT